MTARVSHNTPATHSIFSGLLALPTIVTLPRKKDDVERERVVMVTLPRTETSLLTTTLPADSESACNRGATVRMNERGSNLLHAVQLREHGNYGASALITRPPTVRVTWVDGTAQQGIA